MAKRKNARGETIDDMVLDELDAMDAEPAEDEDDAGLLAKYGIDFVPKQIVERDAKTGRERLIDRGWIARRTLDNGRVEYAGPTLAWTFQGLAGSFMTIEVARSTMIGWCKSREQQAVAWPKHEILEMSVKVPLAVRPTNELTANYVQVNLSPDLRLIVNSLYLGLRERNATVKDKPVSNATDCLRWLLYQLQQA